MTKEEYKYDSIDLNNLNQMAEDVWLFLTNDKMPLRASIKKEAFLHEVKAMMESARQHYAKQQAIAFSEWCAINYQRDFEALDASLPISKRKYRQFWIDNDQREYSTEELYNQFIEQQNKS